MDTLRFTKLVKDKTFNECLGVIPEDLVYEILTNLYGIPDKIYNRQIWVINGFGLQIPYKYQKEFYFIPHENGFEYYKYKKEGHDCYYNKEDEYGFKYYYMKMLYYKKIKTKLYSRNDLFKMCIRQFQFLKEKIKENLIHIHTEKEDLGYTYKKAYYNKQHEHNVREFINDLFINLALVCVEQRFYNLLYILLKNYKKYLVKDESQYSTTKILVYIYENIPFKVYKKVFKKKGSFNLYSHNSQILCNIFENKNKLISDDEYKNIIKVIIENLNKKNISYHTLHLIDILLNKKEYKEYQLKIEINQIDKIKFSNIFNYNSDIFKQLLKGIIYEFKDLFNLIKDVEYNKFIIFNFYSRTLDKDYLFQDSFREIIKFFEENNIRKLEKICMNIYKKGEKEIELEQNRIIELEQNRIRELEQNRIRELEQNRIRELQQPIFGGRPTIYTIERHGNLESKCYLNVRLPRFDSAIQTKYDLITSNFNLNYYKNNRDLLIKYLKI